jgi:hypothetical protein
LLLRQPTASWQYCTGPRHADGGDVCATWLLWHTLAAASDRHNNGGKMSKHEDGVALQPAHTRASLRSFLRVTRPWQGESEPM